MCPHPPSAGLEAYWNQNHHVFYPQSLIRLRVERCVLWRCVFVHISVCFWKAGGINGLWDLWMFWGRGWLIVPPAIAQIPWQDLPWRGLSCYRWPRGRIVTMATRRLNELMNHRGTPRLRRISVSLSAQREGGRASVYNTGFGRSSQGPRWPIVPKCSESKFGHGGSSSPADSTLHIHSALITLTRRLGRRRRFSARKVKKRWKSDLTC